MTYKNATYLLFGVVMTLSAGLWLSAASPAVEEHNAPESMDGMIGEIRLFAGNFAPRGWAFCDGQVMAINQNQALFSILGTTYGGDGRTSFGLPDLRAKAPVHPGSSNGLPSLRLGQASMVAANNSLTEGRRANSHGLLGLHYIICLQGVYPSRS